MNIELKNAIKITDKDTQYDASAKRLLGQKSILAQYKEYLFIGQEKPLSLTRL